MVDVVWYRTTDAAGATARAVAKCAAQVVVDPQAGETTLRLPGRLGEVHSLTPVVIGFDLHPWVEGRTVERFEHAVRACGPGRRRLIDHVLAGTGDWPERSDLREMVELVVTARPSGGGPATVAGMSARTVRRRLAHGIGLSPERLRVLARVARARAQLVGPGASIAGIAAGLGYVDQAHLHREFVRWSGCTPGAWRSRATTWQVGDASGPDEAPQCQRSWSPWR